MEDAKWKMEKSNHFMPEKPKQEIFSNINIFSAMDKQAQDNVTVTKSGIIGDGVGNVKFHGGPDRALCFYPFEHYSLWNEKFSKQLDIPAFGENLTIAGMKEEKRISAIFIK